MLKLCFLYNEYLKLQPFYYTSMTFAEHYIMFYSYINTTKQSTIINVTVKLCFLFKVKKPGERKGIIRIIA